MEDVIEQKLAQRDREVLEKIKTIQEIAEIQYVPGFEDKVGMFPKLESLEGKPVLARFSYGKRAGNMSAMFFDSNAGESEISNARNRRDFFKSQGFSENRIQVKGKFEGTEAQIEEVSLETLQDKKFVVGNLIFTRDPQITMYILPADCPVAVILAKDKNGNPIVAIDHSGADAANAGITRQGLWYLQDEIGVDLSQAEVSIFPGVSKQNYYISQEWVVGNEVKERGSGIVERNWGPFITPRQTEDPFEHRYVDITSALEMQLLQAGVKPENIEAYRRDTYWDAARKIAYSRRYSNDHNGERPGGNLVAVQLKPS